MQRASYVLSKELFRYKRGAANLWPDYPLDFSTELGDVGWFGGEGQFIRLFNCFGDGYRNNSGIPPKFDPLQIPEEYFVDIEDDLKPGELLCTPGALVKELQNGSESSPKAFTTPPCNGSLTQSPEGTFPNFPATIQFPQERGAFMVSQYSARRRYIKPNDLIQPYFITSRESWYQLSRERYHIIDKDDFIFISGQVETNQWAIGVSQQKDSLFTLDGQIGHRSLVLDNEPPNKDCDARAGPERRDMRFDLGEDSTWNPMQDQSIFLNFYKSRPRLFSPTKIVATSEPHSRTDDRSGGGSSSNVTSFVDPALEYILEVTTCDVAIVGDIEVYQILGDDPWPENLLHFLRDKSPKVVCRVASGISYGHFLLDSKEASSSRDNVPVYETAPPSPIHPPYCSQATFTTSCRSEISPNVHHSLPSEVVCH